MTDQYRFLDPWTLMLPETGGWVLAAAGAGGKSQLLRRLWQHYRDHDRTVLWSQTVAHTAPAGVPRADAGDAVPVLRERLRSEGSLFIAGAEENSPAGETRAGAIDLGRLESLRHALAPDVVLVEAHAPSATPLRKDGVVPVWPEVTHLAFLVAHLGAVGRVLSPSVVAGAETPPRSEGEEPVRISTGDVLGQLTADGALLQHLPGATRPVPFFTGFGSFRDMDGMFELVSSLWEHPLIRLVCLAELGGDPRRDAADLAAMSAPLAPGDSPLSGDRVYALYPAELDDEDPPVSS